MPRHAHGAHPSRVTPCTPTCSHLATLPTAAPTPAPTSPSALLRPIRAGIANLLRPAPTTRRCPTRTFSSHHACDLAHQLLVGQLCTVLYHEVGSRASYVWSFGSWACFCSMICDCVCRAVRIVSFVCGVGCSATVRMRQSMHRVHMAHTTYDSIIVAWPRSMAT